jgi:hypothetical protein
MGYRVTANKQDEEPPNLQPGSSPLHERRGYLLWRYSDWR